MDVESLRGVLTFDVEDWDHANFPQLIHKKERIFSSVRELKYAMDTNIELWIKILEEFDSKSTCFVLGDFARRFPHAVQRLHQAGHEVATHGPTHELIYQMNQKQFRDYLQRGIGAVGDLIGKAPLGFRAPSWSGDDRVPWLCEELENQGIRYDSSIFPVRTPYFGQSSKPLKPYWEKRILRIPVNVFSLGMIRFPFSSGAFFRLTPLSVIRMGLTRSSKQGQLPMIVLHPRELDPLHPRLPLRGWEGFVHYANLDGTVPKLKVLLKEMKWTSIEERYRSQLDTPGTPLDN